MDSYTLKQEQNELLKSVSELKKKVETYEIRIKELHAEEVRYLSEIPNYKKQAEESKIKAGESAGKVTPLQEMLENAKKELIRVEGLTIRETQALAELKEIEKKIIEENKIINEQIKQRHEKLKERELVIDDREKKAEAKEIHNNRFESELDNRQVDLSQREKEIDLGYQELNSRLEIHDNNLSVHAESVRSLAERKKFHAEDEQLLKDKLAKADKFVKDQIELKVNLLLQSENLKKEIELTKAKQVSLDKNIADLVNQENVLKIKELKIKKIAHDAGIEKELKELEASLK